MNQFILLFFLTTCLFSTNTAISFSEPFDEIHLKGYTDSTSIDIIIYQDSIIVYEIQLTYPNYYIGYKLGPRTMVYTIKDKILWEKLVKPIKYLLSGNVKRKNMIITHANVYSLKIIGDNILLKEFSYYNDYSEVPIFTGITYNVYNTIIHGIKSPFLHTSRLLDLSNITNIDSIGIVHVESKLVETALYSFEKISTLNTYSIIKDTSRIKLIQNIILNLKILTSPELDVENKKFQPKFQLNFYKSGFNTFNMKSDSVFISYNKLQSLLIDSTLMNALK